MTDDFVRNRITQLRLQKGVSEYQMSYDLGHSRGYIYNISSGKSLPPLSELFAICDYFGITPPVNTVTKGYYWNIEHVLYNKNILNWN